MNILLLAFALPIATILLSIVLQKILKCPLLVAATFFAVLLIITYAVFDSSFLVFAILYTILAYVTAVLTRLVCNLISRFNLNCYENCVCGNNRNSDGEGSARSRNCNVSSGTWCCTTRNVPRIGSNQISANALANGGRVCTCNNNSSEGNDPVIILTNADDVVNSGTGRSGRNSCNCSCSRR